MAVLVSYLTFNGNCREAMEFYQSCFGGDLHFQTLASSPLAKKLPDKMKQTILHATLKKDNMLLMGTDMVGDSGYKQGNSMSLALQGNNKQEITRMYKKLSKEGVQNHPLEFNYWGNLFGDLTDKYGVHWLLSYTRKL